MTEEKQETKEKKKAGYTKAQLLKSKRYTGVQKDILNAILDGDRRYTHNQVEKAVAEFIERRVN